MSSLGPPPPDGDQNRGPAKVIPEVILTVVATIAVIARYFARAKGANGFHWDDYTMFIASVS